MEDLSLLRTEGKDEGGLAGGEVTAAAAAEEEDDPWATSSANFSSDFCPSCSRSRCSRSLAAFSAAIICFRMDVPPAGGLFEVEVVVASVPVIKPPPRTP